MENKVLQRIYLNDDWLFTESYSDALLKADPQSQGVELTPVRLPHTCRETPLHYFDESVYQMVCGYRRSLYAPEEWQGRQILLTLEGVAHDSEIFCNGRSVGAHHCGYTAHTVNLTDFLDYGAENILVVRVDSRESLNIPPFGFVIDYMTYGGIYRDVYLEIKNPIYLEDIYVHADLKGNFEQPLPEITSEITLKWAESITSFSPLQGVGQLMIKQQLFDRKTLIKEQCFPISECRQPSDSLSAPNRKLLEYTFRASQPVELWDIVNPRLYELTTTLFSENTVLDSQTVTLGFREAVFRKDGFYLNGQKIKIRGLNRHQSYPYAGYAMPQSMQELDADILKGELGLNAVRTSHYPQSHYFLKRCDELGLLVFTEIPGWQHIGDEEWKQQAVQNVADMICQYRNHPSIILWGVRINESPDDDEFYKRTNEVAHRLDPFRQTGGVRCIKNSSLLEDVYTYNDFVHDGKHPGCEKKKSVTSNGEKPYLVSEYNGHMYPTKAYDSENHRLEHALRHARVLNDIAGEEDITGSFGWCMFDYNTHKDFGSGDRICYHGVMDMFRNPKPAAYLYASQQEESPVLELSSSMDIGEHPGGNREEAWIFSNADSVRMYKNDYLIKEYDMKASPYNHLLHGPVLIDDYIGNLIAEQESFKPRHAREISKAMNIVARAGLNNAPKKVFLTMAKIMLLYHMKFSDAMHLYTRYVGDWGGKATIYRFEAIKDGRVVKTLSKMPMKQLYIKAEADHTRLTEKNSYDVALIRIQALDENNNQLSFYNDPILLFTEGDIELIGPQLISMQGGMSGTYVKSCGRNGSGMLIIKTAQLQEYKIPFNVTIQKNL